MTFSFSARFFSVALLLAVSSQATLQAQDFTHHPNGVTVLCPTAAFGATGTVGGVTYTKRTATQILYEPYLAETSCTSGITDMSFLFSGEYGFNQDISSWDVSNVTNMEELFSNAIDFNGDISSWDVSNVTNMNRMFTGAEVFNGDLSSWDVSSVTDMYLMFSSAYTFNGDISSWDVSNVTDMIAMFFGAEAFNSDLSSWDVSSVTDMRLMFRYATAFNGDISSWDVSNVTTMSQMFQEAIAFNGNLLSWDVSNVTDMSQMFEDASTFNGSLFSWDVSNVTNMSAMFNRASAFNQNLSGWCASGIIIAPTNFSTSSGLTPATTPGWGTCVGGFTKLGNGVTVVCYSAAVNGTATLGGVTYTKRTKAQIDASNAATSCTSGITDMSSLFENQTDFNGNISSWDVSKVTNMGSLFSNASAFSSNLSSWDVGNVTDMSRLFNGAEAFNGNISSWDVSNVTTMRAMFSYAFTFNSDISSWDVSNVTDMSDMFFDAGAFTGDISSWDVSNVTDMKNMFSYAIAFNGNISSWDVSNVTTMRAMFNAAYAFNGDISSWDVSNVTTMAFMFYEAFAFNSDISSWDVSNVTDMLGMFWVASAFNQDLSDWCVSRIAVEPFFFKNNSALSLVNTPAWGTCSVVQRVISGDAGWRLVSFPITGGTVSDIADDTPIQGITGGANPTAAANVYLYDDSGVFETPADVSTAFGDGKGVAVYFFNNTAAGSSALPVRLDAAGAPPSGDVTVTLNPTALGATLVGNPYASNFLADATNLFFAGDGSFQNNITFWNDGAGSYSVQDRTAPYIIRPWQGFWVERGATGGASTLTFKETGKTTSNATGAFFSKELAKAANRADLRFTLTSGRSYDEAIRLSLRDDANTGHDLDDAGKLLPLLPAYAILGFASNNMLKSVESLPWGLTESVTIPMQQTLVGVDGGFTLAWSGMESFPSGWDLTLHDYQTGVDTDMRADTSYTFDADAPAAKVSPLTLFDQLAPTLQKPASTGTRFALTVNPNTGVVSTETDNTPLEFSLDQNYPNPFNPTTTIGYTLREAGPVSLSIYTMTGQVVATLVNESQPAGQHRHSWDARGFASGVYYYRLRANGMDVTRKMTLIK